MLTTEAKAKIIKEHQSSTKDVGSTSVQIALLSERINSLTGHLKEHIHDYHTERGLQMLVGKRRRLLNYLQKTDEKAYRDLVTKLKLRR